MLIVEEQTIHLTRGDSARLNFPIKNKLTGEPYEMQEGDKIVFTVKKNTANTGCLFSRECVGDTRIAIEPEDTKRAPFGKYRYDVELVTAAGAVYTYIENQTFEIGIEVSD